MGTPKGTKPWNYGTSKGWVDFRGYKWVYVNENGRRRARREHRVVMEKHLKRRLEPWELVHHKDGNTANNALENLEVMEFGKHTSIHSLGSRRDADTRRSMEAFGLLREELKAERLIKADLLEGLEYLVKKCRLYGGAKGGKIDLSKARELIAKAKGEA
jgi:hypothetical protein